MASITKTAVGKPMTAASQIGADRNSRLRTSIAVTVGAIVLSAAIAVFLIFRFVGEAREHDLQAWQVRLGIVADSRAAAIDGWVGQQHATLRGLADNGSLKLYFTRLALGPKKAGRPEAAEAQYLRNLLAVIAARTGFIATAAGPRVRANVKRIGVAGIALLDGSGKPGELMGVSDLTCIFATSRSRTFCRMGLRRQSWPLPGAGPVQRIASYGLPVGVGRSKSA